MIVRLRLLTLVCVALLATSATEVRAQSIEAALAQAYMSNPTLNAQRAAARAFDENVPQALSGYRPTLSAYADVSAETTTSRIAQTTITAGGFPRGIGLQVNQSLFNGFRTANSVRSAEAGV